MPTVRQIAKQAGVSATTVSRVLNQHPQVSSELRQRVLDIAQVSQSTGRQNGLTSKSRTDSKTIALLYTGEVSLGSPFDATLLEGMSVALDDTGYDLLVVNGRKAKLQNENYTEMLERKGVQGAIIRTDASSKHVCREIGRCEFPMVVVGERFESEHGVNSVYSDSRESSREAVNYLIEQGHQRIAIVLNVIDDTDHRDRLAAWRDAHADHNLDVDDRLILRIPANRDGGVQTIKRLMSMPEPPTAIFITDPLNAVGAVNQALVMGLKIPDDLSIVAFDDWEYRYSVYPQLTSVCQNTFDLGRESVNVLRQQLNESPRFQPGSKRLASWFEIHDSVSPVRQG